MKKLRLLIADDDLYVRRALERELRPHFDVDIADCYMAAAQLLARGRKFDAAVVDVGLGRMLGGVQLLKAIKASCPGVTAILISGQTVDDSVRNAVESKLAKQFIPKPWVREELLKALLS